MESLHPENFPNAEHSYLQCLTSWLLEERDPSWLQLLHQWWSLALNILITRYPRGDRAKQNKMAQKEKKKMPFPLKSKFRLWSLAVGPICTSYTCVEYAAGKMNI